jgi:ATP-dependent DNA ligase
MPPVDPMLATLSRELPTGDGLLYEPKWDGFRCLVFRDGAELVLHSRNQRPLGRYFPELAEPLAAELPDRCVVDGEVVVVTEQGLDFDALQQRIHPAQSRIRKLAAETPAAFVAFDLLALGDRDLRGAPLAERRRLLEESLVNSRRVHLTPATTDREVAAVWFNRFEGAGLDGVVAKRLDVPYREGERVMVKVKHERTADCVVGGFRLHKDGKGVGSLLLGLYDAEGALHHVGVASGFSASFRAELVDQVAPFRHGATEKHPWAEPGSEGARLPGGKSRWSAGKDLTWEPLRPELVAEVAYGHMQGDRFRHATRFVRWRPDREPATCTYEQLEVVVPEELRELLS